MARKDPQLNVRLPPDREAIFRAAAFVHGANTPGEFARDVIEQAIDRYSQLPSVKKALDAQAEQAAADEGKLSHLSQVRTQSAKAADGKTT